MNKFSSLKCCIPKFAAILVLVALQSVSSPSSAEGKEKSDFENLVIDAFKKKDQTAILGLYHFDGVHFIFKDLEEIALKEFISRCKGDNFVFEGTDWAPVSAEIQKIKETRINGRRYFYPIPLVAQLTVNFRDMNSPGASFVSKVFYVGRGRNGNYQFAVTSVSED